MYIFFFFFVSFLLSVVINYGGSENEKEEVEEYIFTSVASLSGATSLVLLARPFMVKALRSTGQTSGIRICNLTTER